MNWGVALWTLFWGGCALLVWAATDVYGFLTFCAGLAVAVGALLLADWLTRDRL